MNKKQGSKRVKIEPSGAHHHSVEMVTDAYYRAVFENTGTAMMIINADNTVFMVNSKFEELSGLKREAVEGKKSWLEFVSKEDADLMLHRHKERMRDDQDAKRSFEYRFVGKSGQVKDLVVLVDRIPGTDKSVASLSDITERKRVERDLRENEEKFRTLFMFAHDAIFLMQGDHFIDCNPGTLELFGCSYKDIVGKEPYIFSPLRQPDGTTSREKAKTLIKKALKGEPQFFEWLHKKLNGTEFFAEVALNRYYIAGQYFLQATVRDITARKAIEDKIKNLNQHLNELVRERTQELESLNATKDKFFSIIAHDLKGPVAAIISSTELLIHTLREDPGKNERLVKYSENILRSTQEGYKLLENLLHWSRSQTGVIANDPVKFDLNQAWNEVIQAGALITANKGITVRKNNKPRMVMADRNMVEVILRNLLSNAVKYSYPDGEITITMTRKGRWILTEVKDDGVGIPPKMLSRLFHIENKISTPGTQKERGTGLGLILCLEFIEKCGGTLNVSSQPGRGSTFSFTLPVTE